MQLNTQSTTDMATASEKMIDALASAWTQVGEVAAERIQGATAIATERIHLTTELAILQTRMGAFAAVLETVAAQKMPLMQQLAELADGDPRRVHIEHHVNLLTAMEMKVLQQVGAPAPVAALATAQRNRDELGRFKPKQ